MLEVVFLISCDLTNFEVANFYMVDFFYHKNFTPICQTKNIECIC